MLTCAISPAGPGQDEQSPIYRNHGDRSTGESHGQPQAVSPDAGCGFRLANVRAYRSRSGRSAAWWWTIASMGVCSTARQSSGRRRGASFAPDELSKGSTGVNDSLLLGLLRAAFRRRGGWAIYLQHSCVTDNTALLATSLVSSGSASMSLHGCNRFRPDDKFWSQTPEAVLRAVNLASWRSASATSGCSPRTSLPDEYHLLAIQVGPEWRDDSSECEPDQLAQVFRRHPSSCHVTSCSDSARRAGRRHDHRAFHQAK